jgi:hypothetical protein
VNHGKPETCPLTHRPRGEERLGWQSRLLPIDRG